MASKNTDAADSTAILAVNTATIDAIPYFSAALKALNGEQVARASLVRGETSIQKFPRVALFAGANQVWDANTSYASEGGHFKNVNSAVNALAKFLTAQWVVGDYIVLTNPEGIGKMFSNGRAGFAYRGYKPQTLEINGEMRILPELGEIKPRTLLALRYLDGEICPAETIYAEEEWGDGSLHVTTMWTYARSLWAACNGYNVGVSSTGDITAQESVVWLSTLNGKTPEQVHALLQDRRVNQKLSGIEQGKTNAIARDLKAGKPNVQELPGVSADKTGAYCAVYNKKDEYVNLLTLQNGKVVRAYLPDGSVAMTKKPLVCGSDMQERIAWAASCNANGWFILL